jgi:hypothetical protein
MGMNFLQRTHNALQVYLGSTCIFLKYSRFSDWDSWGIIAHCIPDHHELSRN